MRFFRRRRSGNAPSHYYSPHSSMNIWYGADDAPGVIDVDISSTTRTKLDYYNSSEYENDNMRNGKIEYVNVHAYDDFSWKYRLDEVEQDDDDDILAEEDVGSEILSGREEQEEQEESVVVVVDEGEKYENITEEQEEKKGRGYYIEFDDFINAVALEEEKEEEKGKEGKGGGRVNDENIEEEEPARENEKEEAIEENENESIELESLQKRDRIGSNDSTTTARVQEEIEKRESIRKVEDENERRGDKKGGDFRRFNAFAARNILHDVNMWTLLRDVVLGDKWVVHFDGITSIRFQIDFTAENFRTWKRWTATRCSDISKWLQMRRLAAAASRRRHREEYIRSVYKSPTKEKKEDEISKKIFSFLSSRQQKDRAVKKDINSPQSAMKANDKAPSGSTPKSWKEKEEEALFKILNARKKKEMNGRSNCAAAGDETKTPAVSKIFKDKIARRATILLHICPPK